MSAALPAYDPAADLRWLLLRPHVLISRLVVVLWQLGTLALALVLQGNSRDAKTQKRLAQQILATLTARGCDLRVSVNVVADDLNDPELPLFIRQTCDTWRVSPSRLCFEITESGLVSGEAASAETLKLVRQEGGRLALDDFGTGYSSMDYLRRLPLDELKIDKSFVMGMEQGEDGASVEGRVRSAHAFNREVVAEGVENREAEDALSRMGCDVAQGYLYAPPMPVHECVDWWARAEAVLAAEHP